MRSPNRTASDFTNQLGLTVLRQHVLGGLRWLMRDPGTSDYGIDVHAELVEDGEPTGRLLFLQVKSGLSYFSEPTADGWTFRFDARLHRYWLGHPVPVLVVLVDIDEQQAYWQRISPETITHTGVQFKVEVLRSNIVATSGDQWEHLASALSAEAPLRYPSALEALPPATVRRLRRMHEDDELAAAVLACVLVDGRRDSARTVRALLATSPVWLVNVPGWLALAAYAVEHGHHELSGAVLLRAESAQRTANAGDRSRAGVLALASLRLRLEGSGRAEVVVERALGLAPDLPRAVLCKAIITHGIDDAHPVDLPPDVDLEGAEAQVDPLVHGFLAENASRRGDHDAAVRHRTRCAELEHHDSDVETALAVDLIRRSRTAQSRRNDLSRARKLLEGALDERHGWGGDTHDALRALLTVLGLQFDAPAVLQRGTCAPRGLASTDESQRPEVLRATVTAARQLHDAVLARELAEQLDDSGLSRLVRAEATGQHLSVQQHEAALREQLAHERDPQDRLTAVLGLASIGVDASGALDDDVARSVVPGRFQRWARAMATAHHDLDAALPELRSLAHDDMAVAEVLIEHLEVAARFDDALIACASAQEHLSHGHFAAVRARVLRSAGRFDEACEAALAALAEDGASGVLAAQMHYLLAQRDGERKEWGAAQRHFERALGLQTPAPPDVVWNLAIAHLNQFRPDRAAEVLREQRPPVRDRADAELWYHSWQGQPLGSHEVAQALELADRFSVDPRLSVALLTLVVLEADATGESHRQAYSALERLVERHAEATGVTILRGQPDQPSEQIAQVLRERHDAGAEQRRAVDEVAEAVQEGLSPAGVLSAALATGCVTGLVERLTGVQVAGAAGEQEHEAEVAAASAALGGPVVLDLAVLVVCSALPKGPELPHRFSASYLPSPCVADAVTSERQLRELLRSPGSVLWDERGQRPVRREAPLDLRSRSANRGTQVLAAARRASSVLVEVAALRGILPTGPEPQLSGEKPYTEVELTDEDLSKHASWLAPIALAVTTGRPLWSDDLAVRRLAREHGVKTFGTPALLTELLRRDILAADDDTAASYRFEQHRADVRALVKDLVVDVPVEIDDHLELAREDGWRLGAAAVVVTRPLWWSQPGPALRGTALVVAEAAAADPVLAEQWTRAAMWGAAKALRAVPGVASMVVAALAMSLLTAVLPEDADERHEVVVRHVFAFAQDIAQEHGLPDPAGFAAAGADLLASVLSAEQT